MNVVEIENKGLRMKDFHSGKEILHSSFILQAFK